MTTADTPARALPDTAANALVPSASAGVELRGVVKEYGSTRVLHGVDLDVAPGEFVSLLGPSGCGKTTALRVLAGLEQASGGEVRIGGRDVSAVPTNKRDIGMVFQSYSLFPHLRALENTAFGLRRRGVGTAEARRRAGDALDLVGLGHLADRYAHQMSGGQQQRVALARALVTEPRVLLLDEPLSALDAKVRVQLRDEIRRIQQRLGTTTVFVTHDQEEALAVSDRVAVMGAGRILQVGSPEELYTRPATAEVAAFVGSSSLVPGVVVGDTVEVWGRRLPLLATAEAGPCEVFVRPENVRLVGAGEEGRDAVVEQTTFLGSIRRSLLATSEGSRVHVQHGADLGLAVGDRVRVRLDDVAVLTRPVAD
ncbi:ABC transporter ATP-binding protein [uncultured Microbacterium sp.]|uniref:ABC transporter ATP-binding protein n=1 Tax=uncultured Microbacterium sp. TaxID=191216 RepID=UPI0025E6919D|nr:ABC transporter ATP-binding protein [uncultured Microbacterium sp.]